MTSRVIILPGILAGLLLLALAGGLWLWSPWEVDQADSGWLESGPPIFAASPDFLSPLVIVGIDGATFDLLTPLAEEGRLPTLSGLMKRGVQTRLETLEPTVSPAIWTTIATGKLPQAHGILGFEGVPGQTMTTLPTSQMRRVRAFWNVLTEHGRSVGVIGWWATWPAEPVRGYVVSDRVPYTRMEATVEGEGSKPHEVYPDELAEEIRGLVRRPGEITADEVRRFMPLSDAETDKLIRGAPYRHGEFLPEFKYVHQSDRSTADIAVRLLKSRPTDVTAVAFYGVDTVSHLAWQFMQPEKFPDYRVTEEGRRKFGKLIENYYVYVDRLLGEVLDAAPPGCNVLVFSDHGFGATGRLPWAAGHGRITPGAPVSPDGILILAGPDIRQGPMLERAHVLDLAPTLLHLQGLPAATDMPGRVLTEALREEFGESVPLRRIPTYETGPRARPAGPVLADPELDRDTLEKLRSLGYIE